MSADTDTALHDRWALACGGTAERRAALVWHLIERIGQPSIESQTAGEFAMVADEIQRAASRIVSMNSDAEVAAWLAAVGLGPDFATWALEHDGE